MESEVQMKSETYNKSIFIAIVVLFILLAVIICVGGVGWLELKGENNELHIRLVKLEKVCCPQQNSIVDKREVISSLKTSDLQSLLLTQLQGRLSNVQAQYQVGDSDLRRDFTDQGKEIRQELRAGDSQLQEQLGEVRQRVSRELNVIDQHIVKINKTISSLHRNLADVTCGSGYRLNPHRGTCVRFDRTLLSWFDARASCEKNGEFLASFDTVESASWVRQQQLTAGWAGSAWIAGRRLANSDEYRWYGINTGPVSIGYWAIGEPNNKDKGDCIGTFESLHYFWDDDICSRVRYFLCEQSSV